MLSPRSGINIRETRSRISCRTSFPLFSAHLSGRRLHGSHNPPLVTSLPSGDAIRTLNRLSTRIENIARLSANPQASTTPRRLQGGAFFSHATCRKSGPIAVRASAKRSALWRRRLLQLYLLRPGLLDARGRRLHRDQKIIEDPDARGGDCGPPSHIGDVFRVAWHASAWAAHRKAVKRRGGTTHPFGLTASLYSLPFSCAAGWRECLPSSPGQRKSR